MCFKKLHVMKELNKKLTTENTLVTQADTCRTIVIIDSKEFSYKVHSFFIANNFNMLTKPISYRNAMAMGWALNKL